MSTLGREKWEQVVMGGNNGNCPPNTLRHIAKQEDTPAQPGGGGGGGRGRRYRAAILWTLGTLLVGGLVWFIAGVAFPAWRARRDVHAAVQRHWNAPRDGSRIPSADEQIQRLGGRAEAYRKLAIYVRLPDWLVPNSPSHHRGYVGELLVHCGDEGVNVVVQAARDGIPDIYRAFSAMQTDQLVTLLQDRSSRVRAAAADALGDEKRRSAAEALIAALNDKSPEVRTAAACSLRYMGKRAVEPLMAALQEDKDSSVRYYAAAGLGEIGDPRAKPALSKALQDENKSVRREARRGLDALKRKSPE